MNCRHGLLRCYQCWPATGFHPKDVSPTSRKLANIEWERLRERYAAKKNFGSIIITGNAGILADNDDCNVWCDACCRNIDSPDMGPSIAVTLAAVHNCHAHKGQLEIIDAIEWK
ncbi:MAG: hypothetical protein ACYDHE_17045 [Candidatus Acidiferrales bacterium]